MTVWFRNRIKKLWLYVLFPLTIFSLAVIYLSLVKNIFTYSTMVLTFIYLYFIIRLFKGLNNRDALLIPLLVIVLLIIITFMNLDEG